MTFNDDKWTKSLEITVELERAATLYVFFDDREETPAWLSDQFTDTGINVGLDESSSWSPGSGTETVDKGPGRSIDNVFSVWKLELDRAASIKLGGIGGRADRAMYGIAAVPRRPEEARKDELSNRSRTSQSME